MVVWCLQDGGDSNNGLEAGNMLWLIQRDFLQGKTVGAMVNDALALQPNPHGDRDIDQVGNLAMYESLARLLGGQAGPWNSIRGGSGS